MVYSVENSANLIDGMRRGEVGKVTTKIDQVRLFGSAGGFFYMEYDGNLDKEYDDDLDEVFDDDDANSDVENEDEKEVAPNDNIILYDHIIRSLMTMANMMTMTMITT